MNTEFDKITGTISEQKIKILDEIKVTNVRIEDLDKNIQIQMIDVNDKSRSLMKTLKREEEKLQELGKCILLIKCEHPLNIQLTKLVYFPCIKQRGLEV